MPSLSTSLPPFLKYIVKPESTSLEYWKKILWAAKDLKEVVHKNEKKSLKLLESKHVTLMFTKPQMRFQLAYTLACDLLGARSTFYCDPNFGNQMFPSDGGRVLSLLSDMIIFHGLQQDILRKTISEVKIPVFSTSCDVFCLQKALSDLMTYWEKYDRLEGLTVAWIGPPNSTFNSYLVLCSKFGMNIRYLCMCRFGSGRMSPVLRFHIEDGNTRVELKEFQTVEDAVSGAHIVATSMHPEEENRITLELLKKADPDCVFMHSLPRSSKEVSEEVFNLKNNLCWKTSENYLFIAMAVILTSLKDYQPKACMPTFKQET